MKPLKHPRRVLLYFFHSDDLRQRNHLSILFTFDNKPPFNGIDSFNDPSDPLRTESFRINQRNGSA